MRAFKFKLNMSGRNIVNSKCTRPACVRRRRKDKDWKILTLILNRTKFVQQISLNLHCKDVQMHPWSIDLVY